MMCFSFRSTRSLGWFHCLWCLVFSFSFVAVGCKPSEKSDGQSNANGAGDSAASGGLQKVSLLLNWYPEAEHGGFYAAKVHGLFEKEGLDVEIRPGGENAPIAQELVSQRVTFSIGNADDVLLFRQQGADIVSVFAPIQQTPRCIMVRASSGIDSLSKLKGLTLQANKGQAFLSYMETRGMLEGVQVVPYSGSVARFVADEKTAIQAYNFSEPQVAEQKGVPCRTLMLSEIGFNPYASCLMTTSETVAKQPELVAKMVRACRAGWAKYFESPQETNAAILSYNSERMTSEALAFGVEKLKPLCQVEGNAQLGEMSLERWQTLINQFIELKLVTAEKVKAEQCFNNVATSAKEPSANP